MIPIFVGYALLVWWPACVWRRRPWGFLVVFVGSVVVFGAILLHSYVGAVLKQRGIDIYTPVLQHLLWPYMLMVGGVGLFIAVLPRRYAEGRCHACGYDLAGAAADDRCCPECGKEIPVQTQNSRCAICGSSAPSPYVMEGVCPDCGSEFRQPPSSERVRARQEALWGRPSDAPPLERGREGSFSAPHEPPDGAEEEDQEWEPADQRPAHSSAL